MYPGLVHPRYTRGRMDWYAPGIGASICFLLKTTKPVVMVVNHAHRHVQRTTHMPLWILYTKDYTLVEASEVLQAHPQPQRRTHF